MSNPQRTAQQILVTNFGSSPSGYTGSQGVGGYVGSSGSNGTNGYTGSAGPVGSGTSTRPKVTAIAYSGDDTATNPAGGDTIALTGTGFSAGAKVIVNGVQSSVVSVVSATTINFTAPAMSAGGYVVYVVNTDGGTAILVPGIQYSGTPTWTTASGTLGTASKQTSFTANLAATGDAPITYSITSGALPSGLTLTANTGVISGTTPNISSSTTYNFTVRATDAQRQDTDRAFSIAIVVSVAPSTVEYLVIGGGGAGGRSAGSSANGGGGGGAGGLVEGNVLVSSGITYTVTIGTGGTSTTSASTNGSDTTAFGITAKGGGAGGYGNTSNSGSTAGENGGSGGGGVGYNVGGTATQPSSASGGYGFAGGTAFNGMSGGGGAGAAGEAGDYRYNNYRGSGGIGRLSSITGTATYYAGGGGAGGYDVYAGASGGTGGGGNGSLSAGVAGGAGTANTGGGGGGGHGSGTANAGGSGGSGVVIIRYVDSYAAATSTTGSPTVTVAGGYRIYKFTASGSITI